MNTYYFSDRTKKHPWKKWTAIILAILLLLIAVLNMPNSVNTQGDSIEIQRDNNFEIIVVESKNAPDTPNIRKNIPRVGGKIKLENQQNQNEVGPLLELDLLAPIKKIP